MNHYAPPSLGLVLISRDFNDRQDGIVNVTLQYKSKEVGTNTATYTMNASPASIPILSAPEFATAPDIQKAIAQEYINGKTDSSAVWKASDGSAKMRNSQPPQEEASKWRQTTLKEFADVFAPARSSRLIRLARRGIKAIYAPKITWTEHKTDGSIPRIGRLGEQSSPRGPHPTGFKWQLTRIAAQEIARDDFGNKRYSITTEWNSTSENTD